MKILRKIRIATINLMIIFGLVLITISILDWYNPYMDFLGHAFWCKMGLGIAVVVNIVTIMIIKTKSS